jgi:3-phosphoshikimate 1-carboxyvinyltransferase
MVNGLNQLGILCRKDGADLIVDGKGGKLYAPRFPIPVGNAGTVLRFLMGIAALAEGTVAFEGHPRMSERPMSGLLEALKSLGTETTMQEFAARYFLRGGTFVGGRTQLRGDVSSQFISSVLLIAPYAKKDVHLELEGEPVSDSYVQMTIRVMQRFGVHVDRLSDCLFRVKCDQCYKPTDFTVEADWSCAAYFLAAEAITGGRVDIEGIRFDSIQGDARIVQILKEMGWNGGHVSNPKNPRLRAIDVDLRSCPDLVPTVAVLALFAKGTTRVRNVHHLHGKESDRLEAIATELGKVGANVHLLDDGLEIEPSVLRGAQLGTHDDHRLAMSFALIGLRVPGITIENPDCVRKSFPRFWEEFEKIGQARSIELGAKSR